ncbi:serine/threonine-protein kinase Sgk2 [Drechmeria coniospora]|uniref:EKC/KEOPS complex subunit BUD32 n=1 Tax=Drechmeria coniospora TaxID=98403 RepID=A0A151GYC1_DRECN|nr:serine/threonine-protein kinase Sgk2 [Drechmeria coniospora]KYK62108.1 serine/threonine-protein kinase Sgk2 [Drechmeria coniospora]
MLKGVMAVHNGKKWTGFPATPDEKPVWDWPRSLQERAFSNAPYKLHTTKTANQFKERKGQMDLFFQTPATRASATFKYKQVLVVGEQKKSYDTGRFKADLLQLTRYVRGVFTDQPTRRFVHGFTLCASTMELWVFDRSGSYSSGPFDIHDEPDKLAHAIVGYATMDDDAMGLDTFIERKSGYRYATLDNASGNESRTRLGAPIVRQKAIVCRGTTCFKAGKGDVAKFSWASDKRKLEVNQLKLAEERGVKRVARVVAHRRITTIADMREGLQFLERHRFQNKDVPLDDPPLGTASVKTSSNKRESSSDYTSDASGSKRRRSNRQKSKLATKFNEQLSITKTKPTGRIISDYETVEELLETMRDAIKVYQSLYIAGKILHRDISSNNIIITDPKVADGFKGMLIDLDLAKVRDSSPSGARHQTGTLQFMAVEVLRKADHTYRYDLKSFFYVLLWMYLLRKWEMGSFKDIARIKAGDMTVDGLEEIMGEFADALDAVKPLCLRIRKILFPLDKDERMSFGTPAGDPNQLYEHIIAAFDEAIRDG